MIQQNKPTRNTNNFHVPCKHKRIDNAGFCANSFCGEKITDGEPPLPPMRPKRWSQEAIDKSLFAKIKLV